jgi:hypothetical protein
MRYITTMKERTKFSTAVTLTAGDDDADTDEITSLDDQQLSSPASRSIARGPP